MTLSLAVSLVSLARPFMLKGLVKTKLWDYEMFPFELLFMLRVEATFFFKYRQDLLNSRLPWMWMLRITLNENSVACSCVIIANIGNIVTHEFCRYHNGIHINPAPTIIVVVVSHQCSFMEGGIPLPCLILWQYRERLSCESGVQVCENQWRI